MVAKHPGSENSDPFSPHRSRIKSPSTTLKPPRARADQVKLKESENKSAAPNSTSVIDSKRLTKNHLRRESEKTRPGRCPNSLLDATGENTPSPCLCVERNNHAMVLKRESKIKRQRNGKFMLYPQHMRWE